MPMRGWKICDPRVYQILFLGTFLWLGVATRDWTLHVGHAIAVGAACLGTQWIAHTLRSRLSSAPRTRIPNPGDWGWRSALITALGLCLLLRANSALTMVLAGGAAIGGKFLLRSRGKHFFNPANFGIITALCLTGDAWVSPGQWGSDLWLGLLFAGAGGIVLRRVGRWDTSAVFWGSYALLEALRNAYLGWTPDVLFHRLASGSLLLFALFMVTDPRSIPNARTARVLWAIAIAALTFVLRNAFYLTDAPFWALFALSPLTLLLDRVWAAPAFQWRSPAPLLLEGNRKTAEWAIASPAAIPHGH